MSPLETGTSPILPPPPPLVSKSFVPDKKTDGSKKSSLSGLVEPEDGQVASQSSSHTDVTASKTLEPAKKRTMKRNYLKPHNGCELHMKSITAIAGSFSLCQLQANVVGYFFITFSSLDDTHGLDGGAQVCHTSGGTVHRPSGSSQRDQLGSNERETVVRRRHEDALVLHQEGGVCVCVCVCVSALYHQNSRTGSECHLSLHLPLSPSFYLLPPPSPFFPSSSSSFSLLPLLLLLLLYVSSPPSSSSSSSFLLPSSSSSFFLPFLLYYSVSRQYSTARDCDHAVALCQTDCGPVCARRHQVKSEVHSVKCTVHVN